MSRLVAGIAGGLGLGALWLGYSLLLKSPAFMLMGAMMLLLLAIYLELEKKRP